VEPRYRIGVCEGDAMPDGFKMADET